MNAPERLPIDRRTFIGGSDAAAILGVSPWKTALQVYLQKRGETDENVREDDPELIDLLETGKEMEAVIVNRLIRRFGVKVTKRSSPEKPNRYVDPEHSFLASEVDFEWEVTPAIAERFDLPRELVGTIQNGEAKKVHQFATAQFGEEETEEVPIQYAAQAAHGLGVTGRQLCMFAVQLGDNLAIYWIKRDEEIIRPLRARLVAFWNDHVVAGVPPKPMDLPDVIRLLKRAKATEVEASPEVAALLTELEQVKQKKAAAEDREVEIKYLVGLFVVGETGILLGNRGELKPGADVPLGTHLIKSGGAPLLKLSVQSVTRVDTAMIKEKHPEIAAECSKTSKSFRFDPPRKKKAA